MGLRFIERNQQQYQTIFAHYHQSDTALLRLREKFGSKIIPIQADFMDEASTRAFAEQVLGSGVWPDHMLHLPARPLNNIQFSKTTWQTFEAEISTSLRSAVMISQAFLPAMTKQKYGKLVFMLSFNVVNQPPIKYAVPYTSVKYALLGLVKGLAAEYADKGITVNGVSPSMTETKFLSNVPQLIVDKNAAESPLKRNLLVDEVLPACEFLFSEGADRVTGQNIAVTGGN